MQYAATLNNLFCPACSVAAKLCKGKPVQLYRYLSRRSSHFQEIDRWTNFCPWLLVYLIWVVLLQETFERAKAWVKELQRQASPNIVIALAGNKADLAERRLVEFEVTHCAIKEYTPI